MGFVYPFSGKFNLILTIIPAAQQLNEDMKRPFSGQIDDYLSWDQWKNSISIGYLQFSVLNLAQLISNIDNEAMCSFFTLHLARESIKTNRNKKRNARIIEFYQR